MGEFHVKRTARAFRVTGRVKTMMMFGFLELVIVAIVLLVIIGVVLGFGRRRRGSASGPNPRLKSCPVCGQALDPNVDQCPKCGCAIG